MNHVSARTRHLTRAGIIAALYVAATLLLAPLSFGAVQCRVAEALCLLPVLTPAAVPGLFIGCLIANMLGTGLWYDALIGSLTTLLAALLTRALRNHSLPAALPPVLLNGLCVGSVVYFAYQYVPGQAVNAAQWALSMLSVACGEAVACCILGILLVSALKKLPKKLFN